MFKKYCGKRKRPTSGIKRMADAPLLPCAWGLKLLEAQDFFKFCLVDVDRLLGPDRETSWQGPE